jgi:cob(I)alamin adenosyltransferase
MKIYTKTGDGGDTGLFGGGRVAKSHPRVEAYGTVDELNSFVGLAVMTVLDAEVQQGLEAIQHDLFSLGAILATASPDDARPRPSIPDAPLGRIAEMEGWIDDATAELEELRDFILPGGTRGAALLHVCRTVCRRAERAVVALAGEDEVDEGVIKYLNRLSDLFFSWARLENHRGGEPDVKWKQDLV